MSASNQQLTQNIFKKLKQNNRQYGKEIGMGIIFVLWLIYSAFALGFNILTTPAGLQCTQHIAIKS
jgi:hypothetical protein